MKIKVIIVILSSLLAISLAFNALLISRIFRDYRMEDPDWYNPEKELRVGDIAPDFSAELLSGEIFTLSENRGTVVVLDFWATWCGPCVEKMPTIQTLSEQHESNVIFVGMNVGEDSSWVQDFIAEKGFTYSIGLDEDYYIHRNLYPTLGIPYLVIINGDGMITKIFLGGSDTMHESIEKAILDAQR